MLIDNYPEQYAWPVKGRDVFVTSSQGPIPHHVAQKIFEVLVADGATTIVIFGTRYNDNGELAGLHYWPYSLLEVAA